MRLISQDGMIDAPYENLTISVDNDNDDGKVHILARGIVEYLSIIIAVYSNTDKALKVMEMLRNKYAKFEIFKSVYQKGLLTELNKELGFDEMQNTLTPVFQFPAEEEVEV